MSQTQNFDRHTDGLAWNPPTLGDMLICSTTFSDARGWHSAQHLRKSVLFRRGMDLDLDLVQGHPKQTWIIEYVESPHQTAAFFCVWKPIYMLQMVTENWPRRVEEPKKNVILTFWKIAPGSLQGEGISSKLLPLIDFFHPKFHWKFSKTNMIYQARRQLA